MLGIAAGISRSEPLDADSRVDLKVIVSVWMDQLHGRRSFPYFAKPLSMGIDATFAAMSVRRRSPASRRSDRASPRLGLGSQREWEVNFGNGYRSVMALDSIVRVFHSRSDGLTAESVMPAALTNAGEHFVVLDLVHVLHFIFETPCRLCPDLQQTFRYLGTAL